jgi:hypothetical protein
MGWSAAKIQRALEDSAEALQQTDVRFASPPGIRADVVAFIGNIADAAGEATLIIHQYRGTFAEETVQLAGTVK